jgi:hypothetical protein
MPRHHAVRHLVEQHGAEKQQAGYQRKTPILLRGPIGMQAGVLALQRKRDQGKNHEPTGMQENGDPEEFADADSAAA